MNNTSQDIKGYPELLEDLWSKITEALAEDGVEDAKAREASFQITEYIRAEWGGRRHYTPKRQTNDEKNDSPMATEIALPSLSVLRDKTKTILSGMEALSKKTLPDRVVELVKTAWIGEFVYVPKGTQFDLRRRDYEIWRQWDGTGRTRVALSKRYDLSEMRLYQIVEKVRKSERKRTQPHLPGLGE